MAPVIVEGSNYFKNQPGPSGQEKKTVREANVCASENSNLAQSPDSHLSQLPWKTQNLLLLFTPFDWPEGITGGTSFGAKKGESLTSPESLLAMA